MAEIFLGKDVLLVICNAMDLPTALRFAMCSKQFLKIFEQSFRWRYLRDVRGGSTSSLQPAKRRGKGQKKKQQKRMTLWEEEQSQPKDFKMLYRTLHESRVSMCNVALQTSRSLTRYDDMSYRHHYKLVELLKSIEMQLEGLRLELLEKELLVTKSRKWYVPMGKISSTGFLYFKVKLKKRNIITFARIDLVDLCGALVEASRASRYNAPVAKVSVEMCSPSRREEEEYFDFSPTQRALLESKRVICKDCGYFIWLNEVPCVCENQL
jgi:hypothetical protein